MIRSQIDTVYVNKKSISSAISLNVKKANPKAKFIEISTNTKVTKEDHGLISLSWKDRAKQKKHIISILHRNAEWKLDPNGRSTDFLPSQMIQSGCGYLCSYCYLDRHGPTFIKLYDDCYKFIDFCSNIENNKEEARKLFYKVNNKDLEQHRDKKHKPYITVDIGCDDQVTISNRVTKSENYSGHIIDIVNQVNDNTKEIMLSFASKDHDFDDYAPYIKNPDRNRIRLSIMPEEHRKILELNTSKIEDRLKSINKLVDRGFEVHINLSPIVVTDKFEEEYEQLFQLINDALSDKAKEQMAYEIIFVTHEKIVDENMKSYIPKAFDMICAGPARLEPKWNKPNIFSYTKDRKKFLKEKINSMVDKYTPYARIRYMF